MKLHSPLLPLLLTAACGAQEAQPSEPSPTAALHAAAPVEAPKPLDFVAVVTSHNAKVVSTDFEGRVLKFYVHNGQAIHVGDQIADLDTTEMEAKLREATANRDRARGTAGEAGAAYQNALRKMKLDERLARSGVATPESIRNDQAEASAAGARGAAAGAEIKAAQSQMEELSRLISKSKITAQIDGVVAAVKGREGAVEPRGTQLCRIVDPTQLMIKFAVPHEHREAITVGSAIDVELDKGVHVRGTVKTVTPDQDPNIDFNIAEAEFDTPPRPDDIHVGAGAHVRIADKGAAR